MTAVTLQATGGLPFTVDAEQIGHCREHLLGDKRGFICAIYREAAGGHIAECRFLSEWPTERDKCWVLRAPTLQDLAAKLSEHAAEPGFLPKGFGYPATPNYLGRQIRLEGMFEELALYCVTLALKQAAG